MFNSLRKKRSHLLLSVLLVLFIVFDISIPPSVADIVDTLFGRIVIAMGAVSLFYVNRILGVLAVIAAYELLRRSDGGSLLTPMNYLSSEAVKNREFAALNHHSVSLEEEIIHDMIPFVSNQYLPPAQYRPTLDSLHDAAKLT
uniref:Uncharacterized protein n=1 Tax=uncultured marine group II/III euryarchaeote AD1000_88_G11 TaxID=1457822 RepID=A0A075G565_9EURY|nr:hypothetical protein [uncultured marine group II/III euryarchaeote AD1000_88_G11]